MLNDIELDATKDALNLAKRGVSLARAADFKAIAVMADKRIAYGEDRFRAFGYIDGLAFSLAFTVRGTKVRAISLRRAHSKEMRRYAP